MFSARHAAVIPICICWQLFLPWCVYSEERKELPAAETKILIAAMDHLSRGEADRKATLLWDKTTGTGDLAAELDERGWDVEHRKAEGESFTEVQWQAIDDALKRKPPATDIKLSEPSNAWSLMDSQRFAWKDGDEKEKYWAATRRKLPAARIVVYLSNPGLSADAKTAFVRVTTVPTEHGYGNGKVFFLKFDDRRWLVTKEIDTWVE